MTMSLFSSRRLAYSDYDGLRVTVMGLGLFGGGRGVTEFLCRHGAQVTVTDLRDESVLRPTLEALRDLPVRTVLGLHREEDFTSADLVVVSPAIPRTAPLIALARDRGVPLDTEMNLFFKHCAGKICGVTGSNGKTTTTSLLAAMAIGSFPGLRMGGNVGRSLLPRVDEIGSDEWVVLELSSFQLEDLEALDRRPEVSVVTNLSPNHLDRHGSYERYLAAKREILRPDRRGAGVAVLNADDEECVRWGAESPRRIVWAGTRGSKGPLLDLAADRDTGRVLRVAGGEATALLESGDLRLPGHFNLLNAALAAGAALAMGASPEAVREGARGFRGVPHRLEPVGSIDGVDYYNDSIATTPESTIAALGALGPRVVLICGGASKGCSFDALGREISQRASHIVLIGATAAEIARSIEAAGGGVEVEHAPDLRSALACARRVARTGDRVVLSPACPSYDQFVNFEERGDLFRSIVRGWVECERVP